MSELASIVRMQEDRTSDSALMPTLDMENTKRIHEVRRVVYLLVARVLQFGLALMTSLSAFASRSSWRRSGGVFRI